VEEERVDRRVKYTKMVLRESLLDIMKVKPISKITSAELCRGADINRNTFYAHYRDPADLLRSIEEELYDELKHSIERSLKYESIPSLVVEICELILRNLSLCRILFSEHGDRQFLDRIIYLAHDRSVAEWRRVSQKRDPDEMEMFYDFSMQGSLAVIQRWIRNGAKESPDEIAQLIDKLTTRGLRAFIK